jgi:hypothetical protein
MRGQMMSVLSMKKWCLLAMVSMLTLAGCKMSDLVSSDLPPTTVDPDALRSEEGALALYRGSLWAFRRGFGGGNRAYIIVSGRLTDELTTGAYIGSTVPLLQAGTYNELDVREIPEDHLLRSTTVEPWYRDFHLARNQAVDAIHYLRSYAPFQPQDLVGHMFAIRGYALIHLADALCSGIPLTDYRSPGGFDYKAGSSTEEVYTLAVAQFDSALANSPDSARYQSLAKVGKARALMNLGRFPEAAAAVAGVPTNFVYKALFALDYNGSFSNNWAWRIGNTSDPESSFGTIGNNEGGNGLPFVSSNDPRVPLILAPRQSTTYPNSRYYLPAWMFPNDAVWGGTSTEPKNGEDIVLSSGIEARLTEAEVAAVADNASFLTILNALRTNCTSAETCATPAPAGTGGVAGLPPLADPGTRDARIELVMDERAYWMFLTAHRQGDLRRMVRVHGRPQDDVYPTGAYPMGAAQAYGNDTNIPVPNSEQQINPMFKGCINRNA